MDDIKEGKRTVITLYALENSPIQDKKFLLNQLGNRRLTKREFERCRDIIIRSGAKTHAKALATKHVDAAKQSLLVDATVPPTFVELLLGIADYILVRNS
jgi:geranylgeranyl pyrophosphate synthase